MEIAFLHNNIHSQQNDRLKDVNLEPEYIIFCMDGPKGQSMQLTIGVISLLKCANNNEDTSKVI